MHEKGMHLMIALPVYVYKIAYACSVSCLVLECYSVCEQFRLQEDVVFYMLIFNMANCVNARNKSLQHCVDISESQLPHKCPLWTSPFQQVMLHLQPSAADRNTHLPSGRAPRGRDPSPPY